MVRTVRRLLRAISAALGAGQASGRIQAGMGERGRCSERVSNKSSKLRSLPRPAYHCAPSPPRALRPFPPTHLVQLALPAFPLCSLPASARFLLLSI